MNAYNPFPPDYQPESGDFEPLSLDDEICSSAFWRLRSPEDYGMVMARSAILSGYECGCWGATEAFNALAENDLFGSTEDFMRAYLAGIRALAAEIEHSISIDLSSGAILGLASAREGRSHG